MVSLYEARQRCMRYDVLYYHDHADFISKKMAGMCERLVREIRRKVCTQNVRNWPLKVGHHLSFPKKN